MPGRLIIETPSESGAGTGSDDEDLDLIDDDEEPLQPDTSEEATSEAGLTKQQPQEEIVELEDEGNQDEGNQVEP
jgi:hypothetical protein